MAVVTKLSTRRRSSQPALIEPEEPTRPTEHNGLKVLEEELIMHLPNAPFKISKLHLENGTTAFACRDCKFTADGRGGVMVHRNEEHGARIGQKSMHLRLPPLTEAPDIVLAPSEDGTPAPNKLKDWTIGQLLALLPSIEALGDLIDEAQSKADEAMEVMGDFESNKNKLRAYDDEHDELIAARIQIRAWSNYEELKRELHSLRAWKRKLLTRLSSLGFQLAEEDQ